MLSFAEVSYSFTNVRTADKLPGIDKVWKYLAARGITPATADACGLHIMQAVELIAAARKTSAVNAADNRAAIVFPHWRAGQTEPIDWWSARLVPTASTAQDQLKLVADFGALLAGKPAKPGKMFCPPTEPPHAYMPPIYDWGKLTKGQRVYIHESCIKAINGALLGCASLGLNGVWGWASKKHTVALVEELRDLPWRALMLQPVIVYDSNAWDNVLVQEAEARLAAKLYELTGQLAVALRVPKPAAETGKADQGFDDFKATVGSAAARKWLDGVGEQIEISELELMKLQLNNEVAVVMELSRIADQRTGDLMTRAEFADVNYADMVAWVGDGDDAKLTNVPKLWLQDPRRCRVQGLAYAPGGLRFVGGVAGLHGALPNLNLWRGMGVEPEKGDVDPWLDMLVNNLPDEPLRQWFIQWCAYPLQNPGRKLTTYPLVFGPSGMGKNLLFKPLHTLYGRNAVVVSKDNLKSNFNSIYAQRQFIHVDELQRARGDEDDPISQKVKMLTTGEVIVVNKKGEPEWEVENCANIAITSNYWNCIKLDADDRRACVLRWDATVHGGVDRRGDAPYWATYVKWVDGPGPAALYAWLLEQDLRGFDPAAWAPHTTWKDGVRDATMAPIEAWVHDLKTECDSVLPLISTGRCLYTAKELAALFYTCAELDLTPLKIKGMVNELRNQGFAQANGGQLVRRGGGEAARFWIVRRKGDRWDQPMCAQHLKLHP